MTKRNKTRKMRSWNSGTWNFRIIVEKDVMGGIYFGVHDAYYRKAGDLLPHTIGASMEPLVGSDMEDLKLEWERMGEAFNKPVLCGERMGDNHPFLTEYKPASNG